MQRLQKKGADFGPKVQTQYKGVRRRPFSAIGVCAAQQCK